MNLLDFNAGFYVGVKFCVIGKYHRYLAFGGGANNSCHNRRSKGTVDMQQVHSFVSKPVNKGGRKWISRAVTNKLVARYRVISVNLIVIVVNNIRIFRDNNNRFTVFLFYNIAVRLGCNGNAVNHRRKRIV